MTASPFDDLLPGPEEGTRDTYRWATVTSVAPIRVRLDGDTDPVASEPVTLCPLRLGCRVWVQFHGRMMIILGVAGGETTPRIETGRIPLTAPEGGGRVSAPVSFTPGFFRRAPMVFVSPWTSVPDIVDVGASSPTTEGVDIFMYRSTTTATSIFWMAIEPPA